MKVIKDAYRLVYRKQAQESYAPPFMVKLYKIFAVSLNKVVSRILSAEYEKFESVKQLLETLDQIIFKWGKELSLQFDSKNMLERYFQQILLWTINKALYFKRGGSSTSAIAVLEGAVNLYEALRSSQYPETLHICGRFALVLGLLYLEVQLNSNALDILVEGVKCWGVEQKMRLKEFNQLTVGGMTLRVRYKIRRNLLCIGMGIYNIGLAYELMSQHTEALESYRMCKWYCRAERDIFHDSPLLSVQRFIAESSADQESKLLADLEAKTESVKVVEAPKKSNNFDDNDIQQIINSIWSQTLDAKEINDRMKALNFKLILNTIKGKDVPSTERAATSQQSFTERSSGEMATSRQTAKTSLPVLSARSGPKAEASARKELRNKQLKNEQRMLDLDNFFKTKICSDLEIDGDWLEETDPRKRFRQDMIESIMKRESNSHRSVNILKNFLVTKGKDNIVKEPREKDPRALQKTAYYEVGHKMHVLQADLAVQSSAESAKQAPFSVGATALRSPARNCESEKSGGNPAAKEQEQKKIMTKLAERLQRDINHLEMRVRYKKGKDIKQSNLSKKKEDNLNAEEVEKYQSLANSVAHRIANAPQRKQKLRGVLMKSKFAK